VRPSVVGSKGQPAAHRGSISERASMPSVSAEGTSEGSPRVYGGQWDGLDRPGERLDGLGLHHR
jgi:hypothetical protein